MSKANQFDVERLPQSGPTLAEWRKPLLVTFVFLTFIMTGFITYTYVYFDRIHNQRTSSPAKTVYEAMDLPPSDADAPTGGIKASPEANPCQDDSYRSWETFNLSETEMVYRLYPDESFFYINRAGEPGLVVDSNACDELKWFGARLFVRMFEELLSTYDFGHARDLFARLNRSDADPWTWTEFDSRRYFVKLHNNALSYVLSDRQYFSTSSDDASLEEEGFKVRDVAIECPGVEVAGGLTWIEIALTTDGGTIDLERDSESLLDYSGVFGSISMWRTLLYSCFKKQIFSTNRVKIFFEEYQWTLLVQIKVTEADEIYYDYS